ncbi:MAG: ATP-dependent Clp protease ATP-binding subunit, partial [Verrucomicrobiae bacterium]|nr:ATP-dependent Clp protease ATP-binding subunit [Verrucomicrobiae bacterium]
SLGFGAMDSVEADYEGMKGKILEQAKQVFKPEFLNRLDEKIVFHMLDKPDLIRIVDLEIDTVLKRLAEKDIILELDQTAKEFLIDKGYDPNYGARPMRRAVEKHLEDPLAEKLLRGDVRRHDTVQVTRHQEGEGKEAVDELVFTSKDRGEGNAEEEEAETAQTPN